MSESPKNRLAVKLGILTGAVLIAAFAFRFYRSSKVKKGSTPQNDSVETQNQEATPGQGNVSLKDYSPQIMLLGEDGVVPDGIKIQFSRPITTDTATVSADTVISIEPEVKGSWRYETPSALVFTPAGNFTMKSIYTISVESVNIDGLTVKPDADFQAQRVFETPSFSVKRANIARINPMSGNSDFEIVFTGPVDYRSVANFIRFTAGSTKLIAKYSVGSSKNAVTAAIATASIGKAESVKVTVNAGLPSVEKGHQIEKTKNLSVEIFEGKDVEIKLTQLKEGTTGFYIQVVCNDASRAPDVDDSYTNRIYYYDNDTHDGMYVSDRCAPEDASAKQFITFEPAQEFSVVPSRGGFRILGEFNFGEVNLTINSGLRTVDGGVLKAPRSHKFNIPRRKPQVSIVAQGRYLARDAWKSIALKHMNTPDAEIEIRHIPAENLVFWISDESEKATDRNSNLIYKTIIKFEGKPDTVATHMLSLVDILPKIPRGVLEFSVKDKEGRSKQDLKRLIATDINLLVKRSDSGRQINVWAMDFHKVTPLGGVAVRMITKSGRALAQCESDGDGHCVMKWDATKEIDSAPPFAIIASKGDDLTYMKFDELKTEVSEQLIQGRPFSGGETPYRAAIYSDRGVYRPGETAHIVGLLRGADNLAPSADMPVQLHLFDPREKLSKKINAKINAAGLASADIKFESFAVTGKYKVVAMVGGKDIGQYQFNVEDFMPERMKVEIKPLAVNLARNEQANFQVEARYLFGGSAKGSPVELNCELWPSEFRPTKNSNYFYGVYYPDNKAPKSLALGVSNAVISENDTVEVSCPVPEKSGGFAGSAKIQARAAVFEGESGRSTQNSATVPVHPEAFYIGLSSGMKSLQKGDEFVYEGIIVDWNGDVVVKDDVVQMEFVRLESEYDWSWDEGEGSSYKRFLRQVTEGKFQVEIKQGKFKASIPVNNNASGFLLKASIGKARTDLSINGTENDYYWWPSESSRDQTSKPLKPGWIEITGPDLVKKGGKVTVEMTVPFKGRLLLTAETDVIIESKWVDVQAGKTSWEFKLKDFYPNVFVSAFLIKDPHLESAQSFMPDRAFGVRSFRVEPEEFSDTIKIEVAGEIRPNSTLTVDLTFPSSATGRFVTVAAVDEGILSLTRFKSPDPIKTIFEARALGIETFETFGWNVMLPGAGTSSTHGGDGSGDDAPVALVKPVALWSGVLQVPENGKLSVSLEVPQYRGQLRVMAVAADPKRISSGSASVFVRDPLVLQTSLPRFMTEGDQFDIPVTVTNMSGKTQEVALSIDVTSLETLGEGEDAPGGLVSVTAPAIPNVSLDLGASKTLVFKAKTTATGGAVQFQVKATAGALVSYDNLDVPIISAKPKSRTVKRIEITTDTIDVKQVFDAFVPGSEKSSIWVTSNPYADSMQHLKYLIQYPYGCIEQTTSSTRPLLVIRNLLDQVDPAAFGSAGAIDDMVNKGIERVLSMQTSSGGFSYWPGSTSPTLWGTAYATHMLLDAQKQNFPVPKERIDEALTYLNEQMVNTFRSVSTRDSEGYDDIRDAAAYMYYVLALGGKGLKADTENYLNYLNGEKKSKNSEFAEQKYLLMAALHLIGDHRFAGDLKHPDISIITAERRNSWSFYSDFRRRGMTLSIFTDLFGSDVAGAPLADLVASYLRGKTSSWYSTQELVWSVTGLGKYVANGAANFSAKLMVNGSKRKELSKNSWVVNRATEKKSLKLDIDKKGDGKLFLIVTSDGVLVNTDFKSGGEGISIARSYRKADGSALNTESGIVLAGIIYTELTIKNNSAERIENIALVDRFPAGWEIENPRLGRGSTAEFIEADQIWEAAYMNIRDDRIELFGALKPYESKKVYYASRAVLAGRFAIPPVEAGAMYDPRIWAREIGGVTNIKGPWTEVSGQ